jgi:hypothetical protein
LRLLPHPFTSADRKASYYYDISILQAEFSVLWFHPLPAGSTRGPFFRMDCGCDNNGQAN